jgi:hypothetical protein
MDFCLHSRLYLSISCYLAVICPVFYSSRTWLGEVNGLVYQAPPDKAMERAPASRGLCPPPPPSSTCCIPVTDATSYKTRPSCHSLFQVTKQLPKTGLHLGSDYKVQQ